MKKFSKEMNVEIGKEPKVVNEVSESTQLRYKIYDLMDRYLKLETYGSIDRRFLGTVEIKGKELLTEAIMDLLTNFDNDNKIELLESLKSDISDWKTIDNKIDELSHQVDFRNRYKFNLLIERHEPFVLKSKFNKLTDIDTIKDYTVLLNESKVIDVNLKTELLNILNKKFLGY